MVAWDTLSRGVGDPVKAGTGMIMAMDNSDVMIMEMDISDEMIMEVDTSGVDSR